MTKQRILIFTGIYLPGVKAGGPIRTIANLVELLGKEIDFFIVTSDRDLGGAEAYPGICVDKWSSIGNAQILYVSPRRRISTVIKLLSSKNYDAFYINSFFDFWYSIYPLILRRFGLGRACRVILAPRGEFARSALKIKSIKKNFYSILAGFLRFYEDVLWQGSTSSEADAIAQFTKRLSSGNKLDVHIAPDLVFFEKPLHVKAKLVGSELTVVFLSRIVPVKNLDFVLGVMKDVRIDLKLDIYGFLEDPEYWESCRCLIEQLPHNINVTYCGEVENSLVRDVISKYHLLFVPSKGENFGHVFVEALSAGVPILVSDQTPWLNLSEAGVGWDLSLADPGAFVEILNRASKRSLEASEVADRCQAYAARIQMDQIALDANRKLFSPSSH